MNTSLPPNGDGPAEVARELSVLLADSYTLYLKTHNFHWNVVGPYFASLHLQFETQYTELALAIDEIAERIRALGFPAPGSYAEFGKLTSITEATGKVAAIDMVAAMAADNTTVAATAARVFAAAEAAGDQPTCDLAVRRQEVHQKTAWMLRAFSEQ